MDGKGNDNDGKNSDENVDSEEENEILEESPCGRWLKRREEVMGMMCFDCMINFDCELSRLSNVTSQGLMLVILLWTLMKE